MGYDFDSGRQDISAHPFSSHFSPQDARVTTRIDENNLSEMIWSCIHEGGHALYEQGILVENYALPLGNSISLGIHESQSRLWENHVGRSLPYWKKNFPLLRSFFPKELNEVDYLKPLYLRDNVIIKTNCDHIGTKSFTLSYELYKIEGKKETLCTKGRSIMICMDFESNETVDIFSSWKNQLMETI